MYLMYADESGDLGVYDASLPSHLRGSQHYIVSGVIVPANSWRVYLNNFHEYRRELKREYGLPISVELKGREFIRPKEIPEIKALGNGVTRTRIYGEILDRLPVLMPDVKVISAYLNKPNPQRSYNLTADGIFERVWSCVLERFNSCLVRDYSNALGAVISDEGEEIRLRRIIRRMRVFHYVGSHYGGSYSAPTTQIIEDPIMRQSHHSYYVQIADLIAHALYRKMIVKGSLRKYNVNYLYDKIAPIINHNASRKDPFNLGIIHC